jgi:hypothetical protein
LLACMIAACATFTPGDIPPELRGCWIERRGEDTITMRWFWRNDDGWRGELTAYRAGAEPAHQAFRFVEMIDVPGPTVFKWDICPLEHEQPHGLICRRISFGDGEHPYGEHRAEARVSDERLYIAWVDAGQRLILFDGVRDGCD